MREAKNPGQPLRLDPNAESADPDKPAFLARPEGTPVYHGFPVVPETETDGWLYGAIDDYESDSPQTEGDGFVIAPDGSRAGIVWATDTTEFQEISPPDSERWGVYGVGVPRPVSSVEDLVFNFRAMLPALQNAIRSFSQSMRKGMCAAIPIWRLEQGRDRRQKMETGSNTRSSQGLPPASWACGPSPSASWCTVRE